MIASSSLLEWIKPYTTFTSEWQIMAKFWQCTAYSVSVSAYVESWPASPDSIDAVFLYVAQKRWWVGLGDEPKLST